MLISHDHKFIFIHNYKVAGSSVTKALAPFAHKARKANSLESALIKTGILPKHYPAPYPWHITAKEMATKLNGEFKDYFKFGFSRDPWDWQVSLYNFMLKTPGHKQHQLIKRMSGFDEYIDWRIEHDLELQKKAFYDSQDNCMMDFIGKIENIHSDFKYICETIGVETKIPHVNKSRVDNSYLQYYDQSLIDKVYKAFIQDVNAFGYVKPEADNA